MNLLALFDIDNEAMASFIQTIGKNAMTEAQAQNFRMYLELCLMPRDSDDASEPSDSDNSLLRQLETMKGKFSRDLIRRAHAFLKEHVAKNQRPYTLDESLDQY